MILLRNITKAKNVHFQREISGVFKLFPWSTTKPVTWKKLADDKHSVEDVCMGIKRQMQER